MGILIKYILIGIKLYGAVSSFFNPESVCLNPIDNDSCNLVTSQLNFEFVQVTILPDARISQTAILENAIAIFESLCDSTYKKLAYILFDITNTIPAYNSNSRYALKITGKNTKNINKIVKIFNFYLVNETLSVFSTATPNFQNNCLYYIFTQNYNFNEQMAIIGFIDNATSASYTPGPPLTTDIAYVKLTSEVFNNRNIFQTTITQIPIPNAKTWQFFDYENIDSYTKLEFSKCSSIFNRSKLFTCISSNDMRRIARIANFYDSKSKIISCSRKPKYKCIEIKNMIRRYFCFIIGSLSCSYEYHNCKPKCDILIDLCKKAIDPISIYILYLNKIYIETESVIEQATEKLFDSVIGYNPFYSKNFSASQLFDLCTEDTECISPLFEDDLTDILFKNPHRFDSSSEFEEYIIIDIKYGQRFIDKYKIHIAVISITIVIISISVYAYTL